MNTLESVVADDVVAKDGCGKMRLKNGGGWLVVGKLYKEPKWKK